MKWSVPDLDELSDSPDAALGLAPLAVGWLSARHPYTTGDAPAPFLARLLTFCRPEFTVCRAPAARPCPLCNEQVELDGVRYGAAEIRVLGEEEIFAAPDLIYHLVTAHRYLPPPQFLLAVLKGPAPGAPEHRALLNALR